MIGDLVAAMLLADALANLKRAQNQAEEFDPVLAATLIAPIDELQATIATVNAYLALCYPDPLVMADTSIEQNMAYVLLGGKYKMKPLRPTRGDHV
jgi:hypothetical protein